MHSNLNICRLCIVKIEHSLFRDITEIDDGIYTKIQMHLNLDIKKNDVSSSTVCMSCIEKVNTFHQYYQQVQDNQTKFFYMLNLSNDVNKGGLNTSTFETVNVEADSKDFENLINDVFQSDTNLKKPTRTSPRKKTKLNLRVSDTKKVPSDDFKNKVNTNAKKNENKSPKTKTKYITKKTRLKRKISVIELEESEKKSRKNVIETIKTETDVTTQTKDPQKVSDSDVEDDNSDNYNDKKDNQISDNTNNIEPFPEVVFKDGKFQIARRELKQHMERFYLLICNICPPEPTTNENSVGAHKFSSLKLLFTHYKDVHGVKGYVSCCGKRLYRGDMPHHFAVHVNPEEFKCKECDYIVDKHYLLKLHAEKKHASELDRKKFPCAVCNRIYKSAYSLRIHQTEVHSDKNQETVKFQCKDCDMSYYTQYNLQQHYIRAHAEKNYVCDNCGKKFRRKGDLKNHYLSHEKLDNVKCDICGTWLKNKFQARIHFLRKHSSSVLLKCEECDYTSYVKRNLIKHKKTKHCDIRPFRCPYCEHSTKTSTKLNVHLSQHTGIKTQCEFCPKEFLSKSNYYSHRRKWHLDEVERANQEKEKEMLANMNQCSSNS